MEYSPESAAGSKFLETLIRMKLETRLKFLENLVVILKQLAERPQLFLISLIEIATWRWVYNYLKQREPKRAFF